MRKVLVNLDLLFMQLQGWVLSISTSPEVVSLRGGTDVSE